MAFLLKKQFNNGEDRHGFNSTNMGADKLAKNNRNAPKQFGHHNLIFYGH